MAAWMVERRLTQVSTRLRALREELAMIDEQLEVVASEAEDHEIRALVSETPAAAFDANDARKHADAMRRHRAHVVKTITDLEQRQDELLDKMGPRR